MKIEDLAKQHNVDPQELSDFYRGLRPTFPEPIFAEPRKLGGGWFELYDGTKVRASALHEEEE